MTALDTDVLTLFLNGNAAIVAHVLSLSADTLFLPIIVVEETLRGRLNAIRKTQTKSNQQLLIQAYHFFGLSVQACLRFRILAYTEIAEEIYQAWRLKKIRMGTQDMRVAALCAAQGMTLATRNRRDFEQLPELNLIYWS
jgi:tRNA(fMet)-specific endonuclease VapC